MLPGSVRRVKVTISDSVTGAKVDPTALAIRIEAPDGTVEERTWPAPGVVVRDSAGVFHTDVTIPNVNTSAAVGQWEARWHGTGANEGSGETAWIVEKSRLEVP